MAISDAHRMAESIKEEAEAKTKQEEQAEKEEPKTKEEIADAIHEEKRARRNNPDLHNFIDDVDEVSEKIRQLCAGEMSPQEIDAWELQKTTMAMIKKREYDEKIQKQMLYGISGKGEKENGYKWWCKGCHTEYFIDLKDDKCTKCNTDLLTRDERRTALLGKLDDAKKEKVSRAYRRDKWVRWKKSQRLLNRSRNVDYKKWEYWEPETDDEDAAPIVPKDNPEFQALEADMKDRQEKMDSKIKTANRCKERGNECLKAGDFVGAIEHYNDGLEYRKDVKALWTNKALAEIKISRWDDAIKSCSRVIEYAEIFEETFTKSRAPCFKAFSRRALAYRGLHDWDKARLDLREAVKLMPLDIECRKLLEKTEDAVAQDEATKKVAAQTAKVVNLDELDEDDEPAPPPVKAVSPPAAAPKVDLNDMDEDEEEPISTDGVEIEEVKIEEVYTKKTDEPVRVQIEEDSDEDDTDVPAPAVLRLRLPPLLESLEELCEADFLAVLNAVKASHDARLYFAQRREINRRGAKVRESYLDVAIRDLDTAAMLLRKQARAGGKDKLGRPILELSPEEETRVARFRDVLAPRAIQLVQPLASDNSFLCDLVAGCSRALLGLLKVEPLQIRCAVLLEELTQADLARKKVVEAVNRGEDGVIDELVRLMSSGAGTDAVFGAVRRAKQLGLPDVQHFLNEIMQTNESHVGDIAVTILSNICLEKSGKSAVQRSDIISSLQERIKETGAVEKLTGLVANLVGIDAESAKTADKLAPVVLPPFLSLLKEQKAPNPSQRKVLNAVHNLALTSSVSRQWLCDNNCAKFFRKGIAVEGDAGLRSTAILLKMISEMPSILPPHHVVLALRDVVKVIRRDLPTPASQHLAECVKLTAQLLLKSNALETLVEEEDSDKQTVRLSEVVNVFKDVLKAVKPTTYGTCEFSILRANLAVFFSNVAIAQAAESVPAVIAEIDLKPVIAPLIDCLRKEAGAVQKNCGMAVTSLARVDRYKPAVRALKGFESLHQITLQNQNAVDESIPAAFRRVHP